MSSYPDPSKRYPPVGLLAQAGFKQGDFLPLITFGPNNAQSMSTTSTTYTFDGSLCQKYFRWDFMFPTLPRVVEQVMGTCLIVPGADETVDVRIRNPDDGETVAEETGITSRQVVQLGPAEYTPTTTDAEIRLRHEIRTDPGANSSDIWTPLIVLGVKV